MALTLLFSLTRHLILMAVIVEQNQTKQFLGEKLRKMPLQLRYVIFLFKGVFQRLSIPHTGLR